ncbi:MAG: TatD family hydrolase [Patescibacteria group bacterium]
MEFSFFDVHSHIQDKAFDTDRAEVILRMKEKGIGSIVAGCDPEMNEGAVALAEAHDFLWATVGLHPVEGSVLPYDGDTLRRLAEHPKVVAIGETGLDYFHITDPEKREAQKDLFETQIHLAEDVGKPLMIHIRPSKGSRADAYWDALLLLDQFPKAKGNIHFFAGDPKVAEEYLKRGFTLSLTGVLTFAREYDEVVKNAPLEMILSETDCPYVAPAPYRGKRNEPLYVEEVVKKIAEIRGEDVEAVGRAMVENAIRVFGLKG